MTEELGKITKLEAESFGEGRKLFLVPLMFAPADSSEDLVERVSRYWKEVEGQVTNLEAKLGSVKKVFHELIPVGGEAGCEAIKELSTHSYELVKRRLDAEAGLETIEDVEIMTEFMDWSRCLAMGLQNPGVLTKVRDFYQEAHRKRNQDMAARLDAGLQQGEVGMLVIREGHQVQFPSDVQVFYVAPPSLDEIKRWLREREQEMFKKWVEESESEAEEKTEP